MKQFILVICASISLQTHGAELRGILEIDGDEIKVNTGQERVFLDPSGLSQQRDLILSFLNQMVRVYGPREGNSMRVSQPEDGLVVTSKESQIFLTTTGAILKGPIRSPLADFAPYMQFEFNQNYRVRVVLAGPLFDTKQMEKFWRQHGNQRTDRYLVRGLMPYAGQVQVNLVRPLNSNGKLPHTGPVLAFGRIRRKAPRKKSQFVLHLDRYRQMPLRLALGTEFREPAYVSEGEVTGIALITLRAEDGSLSIGEGASALAVDGAQCGAFFDELPPIRKDLASSTYGPRFPQGR